MLTYGIILSPILFASRKMEKVSTGRSRLTITRLSAGVKEGVNYPQYLSGFPLVAS